MSDILIRGMEMPKPKFTDMATVYDAYILVSHNGHATIVVDNEDGLDSTAYPLVPVPEHGRLIDADAFSEKIIEIVERQKYDDLYTKSLSVGEILREVVNELRGAGLDGFDNAPTIIRAEPEKEEMK